MEPGPVEEKGRARSFVKRGSGTSAWKGVADRWESWGRMSNEEMKEKWVDGGRREFLEADWPNQQVERIISLAVDQVGRQILDTLM